MADSSVSGLRDSEVGVGAARYSATVAHSKEVLAQFQDGEVRLIFARNTESGDLFLLPDGEAEKQRKFTALHLRCPIRECGSPRLMTVSRKHHRDGFRHFPGAGGHGPEGVFHMQASEFIAVWLRSKYPDCRVQKEERSNSAGERRADVMITHPSGIRIAFEIQYADLSPEKWQARHDSYKAQGIQDVWLFGHHGDQLTPARREPGGVLLNPTHEQVIEAGLPLLWINAYTGQLGTAIVQARGVGDRSVDVPASSGVGHLDLSNLNVFRLGGTGLTSDRLEELAGNRDAVAAFRLLAAQQESERQAQAAATAERKRLAKITMAADYAQRRAEAAAIAELLRPDWEASELYARTLARFGGQWPAHLNMTPVWGAGIPLPHGQWQAALAAMFIDGRPVGFSVSVAECAKHLSIPGMRLWDVETVVREWLVSLTRSGHISGQQLEPGSEKDNARFAVRLPPRFDELVGGKFIPPETLAEKITRIATERAETSRLNAIRRAEAVSGAAEVVQSKAEKVAAQMRAAGVRSVEEQATNPPCVHCRRPLFDANVAKGYHTVCAPGWAAGRI